MRQLQLMGRRLVHGSWWSVDQRRRCRTRTQLGFLYLRTTEAALRRARFVGSEPNTWTDNSVTQSLLPFRFSYSSSSPSPISPLRRQPPSGAQRGQDGTWGHRRLHPISRTVGSTESRRPSGVRSSRWNRKFDPSTWLPERSVFGCLFGSFFSSKPNRFKTN